MADRTALSVIGWTMGAVTALTIAICVLVVTANVQSANATRATELAAR